MCIKVRVIEISGKVFFVRHWFRWYRVQRSGTDWQKLKIQKRVMPFSVEKAARSLQKQYPSAPLPDILDEKAADKEVEKNRPKK